MYDYQFDAARNLLDIRWTGMFSDAGIREYAAILKREFVQQGFRTGYLLRMDMSDSAVQPQTVLATFREVFADFPKASRIAVITQSAIARMQVQREMTQPYLRIFDTADAGLAWLMEPVPA